MILAFEITWSGGAHAPGNSATLQTVARAFPEEEIRVFAEETHLRELGRDAALTALPRLSFHPIELSPHYRGKTHIVSFRRFVREVAILARALRDVDRRDDCLILMLSCTPTALFAASWLMSWSGRRRIGVQIGLHGNLNDIKAWRSRNPILRRFDLASGLTATHPPNLRFLVLEEAIRDELIRLVPSIESRVDVLSLPINVKEIGAYPVLRLQEPIRIGFVGLATRDKGYDVFLRAARDSKLRFGNRIEFHHVGRLSSDVDSPAFSDLAFPVSTAPLDRSTFAARLAELHYVMLPYREGYYNLSASGALIDAITWLKPMIVSPLPFVKQLFNEFGDMGFVLRTEDELHAIFNSIMMIDEVRYHRQVTALENARASRLPATLSARYVQIIEAGYNGLLVNQHPRPEQKV